MAIELIQQNDHSELNLTAESKQRVRREVTLVIQLPQGIESSEERGSSFHREVNQTMAKFFNQARSAGSKGKVEVLLTVANTIV